MATWNNKLTPSLDKDLSPRNAYSVNMFAACLGEVHTEMRGTHINVRAQKEETSTAEREGGFRPVKGLHEDQALGDTSPQASNLG